MVNKKEQIKNEFTNYLLSKDMEVHLYKIFTKKLEILANTELNDEEKIFLSKSLLKLSLSSYVLIFSQSFIKDKKNQRSVN